MSSHVRAWIAGLLIGVLGAVFSVTPGGSGLEQDIGLDLLFTARGVRTPPPDIRLSLGHLDESLENSQKAVRIRPKLARTQTVLGFACLCQLKIQDALEAFSTAIRLDQGDPLPRLGLGLAKIRQGGLHEGRSEIEIATSLDPKNALIRSYLDSMWIFFNPSPLLLRFRPIWMLWIGWMRKGILLRCSTSFEQRTFI